MCGNAKRERELFINEKFAIAAAAKHTLQCTTTSTKICSGTNFSMGCGTLIFFFKTNSFLFVQKTICFTKFNNIPV